MKKCTLLLTAILFFGGGYAQSFMHGVGTGTLVNTMSQSETGVFGTLMYNPRFTISENETNSLTIGIPLTIGLTGSYSYSSYYGSESTLRYMINAPLMLDINWGAGSSPEAEDRFGFFFGGGFGFNRGSYVVDEITTIDGYPYTESVEKNLSTYGPAANAGVRFGVGRRTHNIEILLSYMKGLNENKPNTFGIQGVFNF